MSIEPGVELFFEMGKLMGSPVILSSFVEGAIAVVTPASALSECYTDSYRDNLNKGIATDVSLANRQQDEYFSGLNQIADRFSDSYRGNLNKGLSAETNLSDRHQDAFNGGLNRLTDRHQDEFNDGLKRLAERFEDERGTTLNR
ncbi:hypothetical protein IQ268_31635 [Oculatella sp. LEGE 06141]|uniref:hypothetical protein n=1 Tax=Oculatella sp. LEGE 06141 TaxID=1828648 RepID=UPI001880479D|nr:hypothetical protein [Oculatella sp. LEGE 06141]MBE9183089.1 hypothetical protein [Oculatella sp. LEGE 06141]